MRSGRRHRRAILLAAFGLLVAGCAQGRLNNRPLMVGTLKSELARVEVEKQQYKRQVAQLEAENARIANELSQERSFSGDLEARLADARELLDRRGLAADVDFRDSPAAPSLADWDDPPRARTQPAADSPQTRRKPPFAQIPGGLNRSPETFEERPGSIDRGSREEFPPTSTARPPRTSASTRTEPPVRWLPVADSVGDSTSG